MPFSISCSRLFAATAFIFVTTTIIIDVEGGPFIPSAVNFVPTSDIGPGETEVHVEVVNRKRVRRHLSTSSDPGIGTPDFEYHLKINSVSTPVTSLEAASASASFSYDVKLQPVRRSVFGHGFKYTEVGRDSAGNSYKHTYIPSREELDTLEAKLYSDTHTKSVMKLEHDNDGDLNLYGVVNGAKIRTRRDAGGDGQKQTIMKIVDLTPPSPRAEDVRDYVLLPVNGTLTRRSGVSIDQKFDTEPELALVFDYRVAQDIGGDKNSKLEYAAITVNGINGFYELTNDEISIKCELVSVYVVESEDKQPFMAGGTDMQHPQTKKVMYRVFNAVKPVAPNILLTAFSKWVFQNMAELGPHDIAALDGAFKFRTAGEPDNTAGLAGTPGACRLTDGRGESMATLFGTDIGANFEGIPVLAHEIGHSMGAPHDGEDASRSGSHNVPSTAECLFKSGYLMGYERNDVYTNPFRFSKCSLHAIKTYLMTTMATCLMSNNKTGRPAPYTTLRQAGEPGKFAAPFDPEKHCKAIAKLNFQGTVAYQIPDLQCRVVKCQAGNSIIMDSAVPARNTPCGDNPQKGKCRNGFCIGQGPTTMDMDKLCELHAGKSGYKLSEENRSDPCSGTFNCTKVEGMTISTLYLKNLVLMSGTICGEQKVCFNKKCVSKNHQDPNLECIVNTGKEEAKKEVLAFSNPKCAGLTLCGYGSEFELMGGVAKDDPDCNREAAKLRGKIFHADIPTEKPIGGQDEAGPPSSPGGHTLQEVCSTKFGAGSTAALPQGADRNNLCSNLVCIDSSGSKEYGEVTPDGAICGPLRRCKSGQCVTCRKQG